MERCVWWVFIYPVAMHGPCGHVCARVAPFTWLLPTTTLTSTRLLPSTAPNHHPNNNNNAATLPAQQMASHLTSPTDEQLQQAASHLTSPMDKQWWWPASHLTSPTDTTTTDGKPPRQPDRQTTTMDGKPPHQPNRWMTMMDGDQAGQWMCHDVQTVTTHVVVTVCKFKWAPWVPSLSPLFTWEPRGHVAVGDMAGLLLLTTLPTPGLCPMSPLRASACRVAMGPFI